MRVNEETVYGKSWIRGALAMAAVMLASGVSAGQPELKVVRPEESAHPSEIYRITCEVSWPGAATAYTILPATIESIDWGAVKVEKAESSTLNGINTVRQIVAITPARTGSFNTPEILIPYRNPEDLTPPETSAPATNPTGPGVDPTLRAEPFILHVKPDRTLAWVSGGLGALLLCLGLGWWSARKRRRPTGPSSFSTPALPAEEAALMEARQKRLDGRPYEFYLSLNRALSACPGESELLQTMRERAQAVGYQGLTPTDAQMNADYQEVERVLARQPREEARTA